MLRRSRGGSPAPAGDVWHKHRHCESRRGVPKPFRHPPSSTAPAGVPESALRRRERQLQPGVGGRGGREDGELRASQLGKAALGLGWTSTAALLAVSVWETRCASSSGQSPPAQAPRAATAATVRCQSHAEQPRRWAGATHADGSWPPISLSLQAGGDGEHGRAPCFLPQRVWDAFEVHDGEAAGVRGLCLSCLGPELGSRVETAHRADFDHVTYWAAGKHSDTAGERVGTDPERRHISSPGWSQCLGNRAAVPLSLWPSGLTTLQRHCRASAGGCGNSCRTMPCSCVLSRWVMHQNHSAVGCCPARSYGNPFQRREADRQTPAEQAVPGAGEPGGAGVRMLLQPQCWRGWCSSAVTPAGGCGAWPAKEGNSCSAWDPWKDFC